MEEAKRLAAAAEAGRAMAREGEVQYNFTALLSLSRMKGCEGRDCSDRLKSVAAAAAHAVTVSI